MADDTDDRITRLSTAARGVRMAIDVLGQEIREMDKLNDLLKIAIDGLQRETGDKPFDIPNGVKPNPPAEKLHAVHGGE